MASTRAIQLEAPAARVPGGFWRRFVAFLVDSVIVSIVLTPLSFLFSFLSGSLVAVTGGGEPDLTMVLLVQAVSFVTSLIATFLYYGWFYKNKGASPGKMLMRLRISSHDTGTNISYMRAGLRETLGKFVSGIILSIGYLMAAFRQDKRALHDFMFGTQVTHEPK